VIKSEKKDYLIFAFYDRMGMLDFHVIESLRKYSSQFSIVFVSDCKIKSEDKKKIDFVEKIISKEHNEMDFGSWKLGLNFLKNKNIENLLLVNDSIIGPFIDIREILDSMKNKKVDFWGITSAGAESDFHIQSYFLYFKKTCIKSKFFRNFFLNIKKQKSKADLVKQYEIGLTQGLISNGMKTGSYLGHFNKDIHSNENCINLFLENKLPFFKVKNFVSNPYRLKNMHKIFEKLNQKKYLRYIKRINNSKNFRHLYYKVPQFKKILISKKFLIIRSKIVSENRIWRFYVKFLGIYVFFFLMPLISNNNTYKSDSNYN
tara:strand:+ start:639 stop:1589 length:951 start_codon:yes stop_codon:yes gene_type:complete